jgi:hypothetical protein
MSPYSSVQRDRTASLLRKPNANTGGDRGFREIWKLKRFLYLKRLEQSAAVELLERLD